MKLRKIEKLTKKQKNFYIKIAKRHNLKNRDKSDIEKTGYLLTEDFNKVYDNMEYLYTDNVENPSYVIVFLTNKKAKKKLGVLPKVIKSTNKKSNHSYMVFGTSRKDKISYNLFLNKVMEEEAKSGNNFFWVLIGKYPYRNVLSEEIHVIKFKFKLVEEIEIKIGKIKTLWGVYIKEL